MHTALRTIGLAAIGTTLALATCGDSRLPLATLADVPLTGRPTRWDYASFDTERQRLFLAHLGDDAVAVFDLRRRRVTAVIAGVRRVHGVLAIPSLGRIYASATGTNEVVAIDLRSLGIVARIPAGEYPDGMAYAPRQHKLFVSDERGGSETVVDVRGDRRIATIALGGEVGNSQYDEVSGHVFANVQTRGELAEIDPATDKVVARIRLPGAQGNHGLLIDAPARLAFVACEDNDRLLVLDLRTRRVTATFDTGRTPDVLAFDPAIGWLYVASESGQLALFAVQGREVRALGRATVGPNAHVVAVDPATHLAYFPLKESAGRPVLRIMRPAPRPTRS